MPEYNSGFLSEYNSGFLSEYNSGFLSGPLPKLKLPGVRAATQPRGRYSPLVGMPSQPGKMVEKSLTPARIASISASTER